ncbi:MAG: DUF4905 domain-containing protein [Chlorobi bacterium]|nr:DUF4905 domain-containing protein [Chlorobiota bacterium]
MDSMSTDFSGWRYHAGNGSVIWRLMFTGTGQLVGQKRLPMERRSLFFSISERSGRVLFDDFLLLTPDGSAPAGESWLTGIETVAGNLVFLHAYRPNSPEHLGLWAVDAATGELVWSRMDIVFCAILDEGFLVYRPSSFAGFPERTYLVIDPASGMACTRPESGDIDAAVEMLRRNTLQEEQRQGVTLPELLSPEGPEHDAARTGMELRECIAAGSVTAVVLHDCDEPSGGWRSILRIIRQGKTVYEDVMAEKSARPPLNSFLLHGGGLYYTKGESELVALKI